LERGRGLLSVLLYPQRRLVVTQMGGHNNKMGIAVARSLSTSAFVRLHNFAGATENVSCTRNLDIAKSDPQVITLQDQLKKHNGLKGLDVVGPTETTRAAELFVRDGFVVVRDVLSPEELLAIQQGAAREIKAILEHDPLRKGNRGSHRYSFGSASLTGHCVHMKEWAMLADNQYLLAILEAIWGKGFVCRGGGGDFCLPGTVQYQPLHSDMSDNFQMPMEDGSRKEVGSFRDSRGRINYRDLPCPFISANFIIQDFTPLNGPIRQIPCTQHLQVPIPDLEDEPMWMKMSTLCGAKAGSVCIRDVRAWHGGTPNVSDYVRVIPNAEFYAPWFREPLTECMPEEIYNGLSKAGKEACRYIKVSSENKDKVVFGLKNGFGGTSKRFAKGDKFANKKLANLRNMPSPSPTTSRPRSNP